MQTFIRSTERENTVPFFQCNNFVLYNPIVTSVFASVNESILMMRESMMMMQVQGLLGYIMLLSRRLKGYYVVAWLRCWCLAGAIMGTEASASAVINLRWISLTLSAVHVRNLAAYLGSIRCLVVLNLSHELRFVDKMRHNHRGGGICSVPPYHSSLFFSS